MGSEISTPMALMREARQRGEPPQNFRKHPVGGGRIMIRDEINDFPESTRASGWKS